MKNLPLRKAQIEQFYDYDLYIPQRVIYLGGEEVNYFTSDHLIKGLHILKALDSRKSITIILNTVGGSEYDMWAIYDTIKGLKVPIKIIAQGACMSAGSVILQAGTQRLIGQNCVFMMHDGTDWIGGQKKNVERWADFGKKYRQFAYKVYYEKMKKKKKRITLGQIEEMCQLDTIFTAEETIEWGLADRII